MSVFYLYWLTDSSVLRVCDKTARDLKHISIPLKVWLCNSLPSYGQGCLIAVLGTNYV